MRDRAAERRKAELQESQEHLARRARRLAARLSCVLVPHGRHRTALRARRQGQWNPDAGRKRAVGRARRLSCFIARSEEHTSELQSLMRISYAVFCLKKKKELATKQNTPTHSQSDNKSVRKSVYMHVEL